MTSMHDQMTGYAELVLDVCAGLRPDELVLIDAELEHAPLARALAEAAYARSARQVDIRYDEPRAEASRVRHGVAPVRPAWLAARYQAVADGNGVVIEIAGPAELAVLPGRRIVVPYPTQDWARTVHGVPDVIRLWTQLRAALGLDEPDPAAFWRAALIDNRGEFV